MAKMIKCPTCGTQIEVPPQASGQIVKCPGCGKGLKLVAKKPAGGGQHAGAAAGMGGNPGGSVAGSSVSAMTFVGDAPPMDRPGAGLDDLPSLDSNCAVCGRAADPSDLVEDNGRLICGDCVKGARSAISRPVGGAELIDFAGPSGAPVRRGKLINFTPSFIFGALAAIIFVVCTICLQLELVKKPAGTLTAGHHGSPVKGTTPGAAVIPFDPESNPAPVAANNGTPAPAPANGTAGGTTPGATPANPVDPESSPAPAPAAAGGGPASNPIVAIAPPANPDTASIFTDSAAGAARDGAVPGGAPPANAVAPAPPAEAPAPAPTIVSSDPLDRGLERLMAHDFVKAAADLDQARLRYVVNKMGPPGAPLTPQQQMTLEGLAAAFIGQGRYEAARGPLEAAYGRNVRTRSITLNTAIYMLNAPRPLNAVMQLTDMLKTYMGGNRSDEYAADIFGTLVNKLATFDRAPKDKLDDYWQFHDQYVDQLARGDGGPGAAKLKWGIDWMPADDVLRFRQARGVAAGTGVGAAAKEVDLAAQRVRSAEQALKNANAARALNEAADVQGAQNQLDAANAALVKAQKTLNDANAALNLKKPRWLTKFEPVIPSAPAAP